MKRIFKQSKNRNLFSGINSSFDFNGKSSTIEINSSKLDENKDFNKTLKQLNYEKLFK